MLSWTGRRPEISNKHHTGMKKTKQLWLIALVWGLFSACGEISPAEWNATMLEKIRCYNKMKQG